MKIRTTLALVCLLAAAPARADVVIPGSLAMTEGDTGAPTVGLFGTGSVTDLYQIAASELAAQGLTVGQSITGVRARLNGGAATAPVTSVTWADMQITMAQAANPIGGMSHVFAANMVSPVNVFSGAFTLPANSMPGGATPNAFGALISFTTPYVYLGGDLVVHYTHTTIVGSSSVTTDFGGTYIGAGTLYRSLRQNAVFNATTGTLGNFVSVLQLETIPEAHSWLMLPPAAVVAFYFRHRRRGG